MGRIVFDMSVSLDGRVATPDDSLEWVTVDEATHALFNDDARNTAAFLLGRRTYELLQAFWPTADADPGVEPVIADFARIWRGKRKYVFSTTLNEVDPTAHLVREVTTETIDAIRRAAPGDLSVGGPSLAASLMRLGLVDRLLMYVNPVVLGGGRAYLPAGVTATLKLVEARTLPAGIARLVYDVMPPSEARQDASAPSP